MSLKLKRSFSLLITCILAFFLLSTTVAASSRKLITKTTYGSFSYASYTCNYQFNSSSVITYSGSTISAISDLSFSNTTWTSTPSGMTFNITPRQSNKWFSGNTATYKVTVSRSAFGSYTDKVDYTIKYYTSDSGIPYSLGHAVEIEYIDGFLVTIEESEPYDIQYLE